MENARYGHLRLGQPSLTFRVRWASLLLAPSLALYFAVRGVPAAQWWWLVLGFAPVGFAMWLALPACPANIPVVAEAADETETSDEQRAG